MDAAQVARQLADALESAGVPYALGGALAYGYWAPASGTLDVDLNLFVAPEQLGPALDALESAGVQMERAEALQTALEREAGIGVK